MRKIVSALAAHNSEQESVLISLDIEDDKMFLLHFIIGTYFGPDLRNPHHHPKKQSAFQIQASNLPTKDELKGSLMKRAEIETVYHHILKNADPSLTVKPRTLRGYFNGKRYDTDGDFPLFVDLFPRKLHPESRIGNQNKVVKSIVFINDPDTSCMRRDCLSRFKLLTGLQSFTLSLNIDVTETVSSVSPNEVENESLEPYTAEENDGAAKPRVCVTGAITEAQAGPAMGLMDIGECDDAYLFRISLPGVNRDERDFSCEVEDDGKVLVRGVTTTGEKEVHRYGHSFEMQTRNLCPPGNFSVSFRLPGPVEPQEFTGSFGTDGILEGIVMKKLQKQNA
uniref:SHSP domain-containing protein n=1 Tax=Noccaea caerulescens TaxID=107243 RepID=A0A1J3E661_NOCCA